MIILLEGAFGESNFGDDMLLLATVNAIRSRFKSVRIVVCLRDSSTEGDYMDRFPGVDRVVRGWRQYFMPYDLKVYAGGTQFYSYPAVSYRRNGQSVLLLYRILAKITKLCRSVRPSAFLGVGIGPFLDGNEAACKKLLSKAAFLSVRDRKSCDYLDAWSVLDKISGADICFKKEWWMPDRIVNYSQDDAPVGIVVRDFEYDLPGRNYIGPLLDFVGDRMRNGLPVECFAFSKIKDINSINALYSIGVTVNVWDGEFSGLTAYLNKLASCSILLTARYHGVVIGAALGVPSIGIEIDPKIKFACDELGEACELWRAPFEEANLKERFDLLMSRLDAAHLSLAKEIPKLDRKTCQMFDAFVSFVEGACSHE